MNRGFSRRTILAAALAGAGLAACDQNAAPLDDQGRVRLRLVLDAAADARHGGFYHALASEHYARRNLNVEIMPGRAGVAASDLLAASAVELAVGADSFDALGLVASGAPVRAVAACFQKDLRVVLDDGAPLEAVSDLAGRPVVVEAGDAASAWPVMAQLYDLDPAQRVTPLSDAAAPEGAAVLTDLTAITPAQAETAALLADRDWPVYGGLILAPEAFARDNARALRDFIIATAEGWRDYLGGDPAPADSLIRRANPDLAADALSILRSRLIANQIVTGGEAAVRGIGVMNPDRWRTLAEAAVAAGVAPDRFDWRRPFTLDYLPGRD